MTDEKTDNDWLENRHWQVRKLIITDENYDNDR
jgi:hypothetical protein